ncbi:hypothetical protein [Hymenobacter sp. DG25B]|uniref:hypothetical protein n=1 Tax=Hymenobacter sp. DG25B TaxID=1385664 RepID=UPI000B0729F9|nr:hypothetical protein [Hymenobacter sp. DG25B]
MLDLLAALVSQAIALRLTCLAQPRSSAEQWEGTCTQLQDIFSRYGRPLVQ